MELPLRRVSRVLWLLIGGGGVLFIVATWILDRTHPGTPANELVTWRTVWIFLPSVLMVLAGVRYHYLHWHCPHCRGRITTEYPIPRFCPRCGLDIGLYKPETRAPRE
jgi:hypothetical protein